MAFDRNESLHSNSDTRNRNPGNTHGLGDNGEGPAPGAYSSGKLPLTIFVRLDTTLGLQSMSLQQTAEHSV